MEFFDDIRLHNQFKCVSSFLVNKLYKGTPASSRTLNLNKYLLYRIIYLELMSPDSSPVLFIYCMLILLHLYSKIGQNSVKSGVS